MPSALVHAHASLPIPALAHVPGGQRARRALAIRRNRILQIQNQRIGSGRTGLREFTFTLWRTAPGTTSAT
jgi:hypothetical protein